MNKHLFISILHNKLWEDEFMNERNLIILCVTAIVCVALFSVTALALNNNVNTLKNNTSNDSVNVTINDTNNTNNTTTVTTKKTTAKSTENSDPDYDPERDDSHKYATEDNPVTVEQSDGVYTYYGPGHYDYYAGDNHMSGGYYKERNSW